MGKKVKIKDIAEKCGFSNTLVSLVLNDKASLHGIKPDTQEKVLFIARQMGYFEDVPVERRIPNKPSGSMVGMIVPDLHNHFIFEIGPLLNKAFSSIGLTFSIVSKNQNEQRFETVIKDLKKIFSGLILYGDAADDLTVRALKKTHYPFVVLEKKLTRHRINEVNSDYTEACRLVAMHILKLGYKNITVIEQKNCMNCMVETGLLINTIQNIIPGISISRHSVASNIIMDVTDSGEIVKALRPPEASQLFVVKHSELVYPLFTFFRKKNIRVPSDLAVIAMDNGVGFNLLDPPVTRINRKYSSLALKVSQMLWSEVKNDGKGKYKRSVTIRPELIIEKSCGALL
ncbi:MAG: LacI family DNA-binding transcriptional regulator [Bacteroidota bacterium]|nr:LacI family DNA-binding transcriptional regulator [Bacteroidota bacterium]